jgi:hypothetical protein
MSILKLKTSAIIARERTLSLPCPGYAGIAMRDV